MEEKDLCWDWIKHEGNVFNARGNFFLVAESMLLVAVATLTASHEPRAGLLLWTYIAGVFVTLVWLYVNGKHLRTQAIIVLELEGLSKRYKQIKEETRSCPWCIPNHTMMGIILPLGLLAVWVVLLSAFRTPWG